MNEKTFAILGQDLNISTIFVEKIILNTKAEKDQDHIKMNIIINNKLFTKNEVYLKELLTNIEKSQADYLVLTFNNKTIYDYLNANTSVPILNDSFNINDEELLKNIIKLAGKELKK